MHAIAQQQSAWMVSGSMAEGGIRITASPSQKGSAVNDQITGSNEPSSDGMQHREHEERLIQRSSCCAATFTLLRRTRNAQSPRFVAWQPTGKGQCRPTPQPIVHVLIRETPYGTQESHQQQTVLAVRARSSSQTGRQGRRTTTLC